MRGKEILNQLPAALLTHCARRGMDTRALTDGLPFTPESLHQRRWERISWEHYTMLLDRIQDAVGGNWPFENLMCELVETSRTFRLVARLLISSRQLLLLGSESMVRRYYQDIGFRALKEPDGRVRLEFAIPEPMRESLAFGYGCNGALRAYPRLVGEPYALVEAEIAPRRSVFLLNPPESHTVAARATEIFKRWTVMLTTSGDGPEEPTADEMMEAISLAFDHSTVADTAHGIGARLSSVTGMEELGGEVVSILAQYFCCHHVMLWMRRVDGSGMDLVLSHGDAGSCRMVKPLTIADREVGRIEVDLPSNLPPEQGPPLFDAILPWVAIAVHHARSGKRPHGHNPSDARLVESSRTWQLTPRQTDVLKLLVDGATNKDIARALGTTNRTVEVHVTQLLRKANADNRATLIARFWGGMPLA